MHEQVMPDQDLTVSKILHSTLEVLYNPISNHTTRASLPDLDEYFSAEDLELVDSIVC